MPTVLGPITTPASTGGAGNSAATAYSPRPVNGLILGIVIQYNDAPPAGTTDVGIKTKGLAGVSPSYNILTVTNAATDGYFIPQKACVDSTGAANGANSFYAVNDYIQLDLAQANDGDSVSIWLVLAD